MLVTDVYHTGPAIRYFINMFTHLKLCLATTTHNFKVVSRYRDPQLQVGEKLLIFFIWDQTLANLVSQTHIPCSIRMIYYDNKTGKGNYRVNSFSTGTDFRRQNLTSKFDPRTERI